ncbi:unnamed protein product [Rhizoctonia solani]|uniref:Peptidase C14 caspase domain-containing protein n=1 Tax=Rhizoctonia solani TaxID=456999 RepID=A0A8H3HE76_9AGAM|nr:unnamed protein product [Rhizoctonia solani]
MLEFLLSITFFLDSLAALSQLKSTTVAGRPFPIAMINRRTTNSSTNPTLTTDRLTSTTISLQIFYHIYEGYFTLIFPTNRRRPPQSEPVTVNDKPLEKHDKSHETLSAPSTPSAPVPESSSISPDAKIVPFTPVYTAEILGHSRGSCKATASPPTHEQPSVPLLAVQARTQSNSSGPCATNKALLIGFNYEKYNDPRRTLRHATEDARRFTATLTNLGYPSMNMRVVTDEPSQPTPSYQYLMECIDWLLQDASEGTQLFFVFSGHCEPPKVNGGRLESCLIGADLEPIPRSVFQERLIAKVPAGAELTIVLDCCNAAGMAKLKYCVGRMGYERQVTQTTKEVALAEAGKAFAPMKPVSRAVSHSGSPDVTGRQASGFPRGGMYQGSFAPINLARQHRSRGVCGAELPPVTLSPNQTPAPGVLTTLAGKAAGAIGTPSPINTARTNPSVGRRFVFEGRPIQYFKERETDFVVPAGKVTLWAGTGECQKAFEVLSGARNGVFTDSICSALDASINQIVRDVWYSAVGAIEKENDWRTERDKKKPIRPASNQRLQWAELWVSQPEPLSSSLPILNQPIRGRSKYVA